MTTNISMLAVDLSKGSFQVCAVGSDGTVLYNRALSRARFSALLVDQPACVVAMEACATSHHWGRVAQKNGHEVRIVPAVYVKPFVKRQKNDRADACLPGRRSWIAEVAQDDRPVWVHGGNCGRRTDRNRHPQIFPLRSIGGDGPLRCRRSRVEIDPIDQKSGIPSPFDEKFRDR